VPIWQKLESESVSRQLLQREIDHLNWVVKVGDFQRNEDMTALGVEEDEHKCGFGKWYYSEERKKAEETVPEIKLLLDKIEEPHAKLHESAKQLEAILQKGKEHRPEALSLFQGETIKQLKVIQQLLGEIRPKIAEHTEKLIKSSETQADRAKVVSLLGSFISPIIALVLGITLSFVISRPIRRSIDGLNEGIRQMAAASGQVSDASQRLAEGASEQAAAIEESSSSLEEMSSMTKQNAAHAGRADHLMADTRQVVSTANTSMERLSASMIEISKASEETSKIIKTIDEIAFQTNLLALNAAVEAARAGEAGAGFAVVADEVRNLAMRAAEAAKTTANLIEGTVKKIKEGTGIVEKTSLEFAKVSDSTEKMSELVGEIAAASHEQAQGIEQINKAVSEMDKVVQQNAANAEESASASEEMNAQAKQMKVFVGELVTMAGGTANRAAPNRKALSASHKKGKAERSKQPFRDSGNSAIARPVAKRGNVNGGLKTASARADQLIPFGDEGVPDF
jgi:methyl-accepting chemotaxis protein